MAHQAHAIPWQTLADNLKYLHCSPRDHGTTNLYLHKSKDQNQGKQIHYFVGGFTRALSEYSAIERKKYDADPSPPARNEQLFSEATVRRMSKTVLRYKSDDGAYTIPESIDDILPPNERTVERFIQDTMPGEGDMFDELRDCCEQVKTLLMYGEMDPLFRLAVHPDVYFNRIWDEQQYANAHGFGLSKLVEAALQAYICLNVITLKPELYDAASRDAFIKREKAKGGNGGGEGVYDYRMTAAYQRMLIRCTGIPYGWRGEAYTFPHRDFFGIPRGMFRFEYDDTDYGRWQKAHLGTQSIQDIAHESFQGIHVPSISDFQMVLNFLGKKGLPAELALQILDVAQYVPVGRLPVRDDPFHAYNADELKKYLSFCWKLLVRVDMLFKEGEHGMDLDWEAEVINALFTLFNMPGRSLFDNIVWDGRDSYGRLRRREILM